MRPVVVTGPPIHSTVITGQTEGLKGWFRRDGWAEEWIPIYILPASGRWSHSLPR
jgi:hypothetical protein